MKVIDLLNKIANGEEVPEKIKYDGEIYNYGYHYQWYLTDNLRKELFIDKNKLNDEIEIIEDTPKEYKKIKKIQSCGDNLYSEYIGQWLVNNKNYSEYDELLMNKINEIIDRLNGDSNE